MRNPLRVLAPAPVYLALALSASLAHAQYSVAKVAVRNGAPYTDAEIAAVSGLQPGQMLAHDSLGNAAQHILDTGLFDDTEATFEGVGNARTVVFALKPIPAAKLMPVTFANFVWFTPGELADNLRAKVPLYRGLCSDAGTFADTIQTALQQMLAAKGITATVAHNIIEPTSNQPRRVVNFTITDPAIRVASINLTGSPAELAAPLERAKARIIDSRYNQGAGSTTADQLLAPLRNAGYLVARLDDLQVVPSNSAQSVQVALTATVVPGALYKVSTFTSDATPFDHTARDARRARYLASMSKDTSVKLPEIPTTMHPGDIASDRTLQEILAGIVYDFHSQGYLDAYINPTPTLDDTTHTVAYALHAVPGDQYHLKSVTPQNLPPTAQAEFDRTWTLKPGDAYNADYVNNFIADTPDSRQLSHFNATFQASADPQTHLVDLTITFMRNGR